MTPTVSNFSRHKTCRRCGKPSGSFWYCRAHRKENAKKATARRQSSRRARYIRHVGVATTGPAPVMTGSSAPTASEAWYAAQEARKDEQQ